MACFIVPAGEALVVSAVSKVMERRLKSGKIKAGDSGYTRIHAFVEKRKWLTNLLWGGSALLAFEHIWHGEVVPWFPFLTALRSGEETVVMLSEMATTGVMMVVVVNIVWICMVLVSLYVQKEAVHDVGTSL